MANFMIRFLLCNVLISGIIGILLIAKWVFRNNLSSRMQYNLWLLLLGLLAVPFMPFRLVSFPQIFSWLSSVQNSTTSHADVGTNNVMNTDLSGTTNWMNDFAPVSYTHLDVYKRQVHRNIPYYFHLIQTSVIQSANFRILKGKCRSLYSA